MENNVLQNFSKNFIELKKRYPGLFNSPHEAIGILLEEFQELQNEVFKKELLVEDAYNEAIDLAVASFAFAVYLDRKKV